MTNGGYSPDEYVLDSSGKPIRDRYGRPVRKRSASRRTGAAGSAGAAGAAANEQRPRQYFPENSGSSYRGDRQSQAGSYSRSQSQQDSSGPRQYFPSEQQQNQYGQRDQYGRDQYGQRGQYSQQGQYGRDQYGRSQHGQRSQYGQRSQRSQYSSRQQPAPQAMQASQYAASESKQRRKRRGGCLRWVGWLLLIAIVLSIVGVLWMDSRLNRVDTTPATSIGNTSGTNWLLVGSDSRDGYSDEDAERLGTGGDLGSMRTDTIMLLHIPRSGSATLVSLPRDSYVNIPGYGQDKINAAYAYGGAPLLVETVEQATGLHIDRYAEIGMSGLANVVDAVGGIEVCPEEAIDDPLANLNIQAGCQEIDGVTALGYVRTRATANGDLDRVVRQREFMDALAQKAASPASVLNPIRAIRLMNAVPASITVGEGDHIWNLARMAMSLTGGLETTTVPISGFANYDVGSVVLWDDAEAEALFSSMR